MAQMALAMNSANTARARALWVPREHGAWGMLLVPLVTGAGAAANGGYAALGWFVLAAIALFWVRTPVESLVGASVIRARTAEERRAALVATSIVGGIAIVALVVLFWGGQHLGLVVIGAAAGLAFVAQAILKKCNRKYRAAAQVIGSIGLTSTAASAYYLRTGNLGLAALLLWAVNWLFAAEQIEFVQLRIQGAQLETLRERMARGRTHIVTVEMVLAIVVIASASRLLPALAILAFAPSVARAGVWFFSIRKPLDVHRLGWMELTNAILFAALLIGSYRA